MNSKNFPEEYGYDPDFKVGDRVRIINLTDYRSRFVGDLGEVYYSKLAQELMRKVGTVTEKVGYSYGVKLDGEEVNRGWFTDCNLEHWRDLNMTESSFRIVESLINAELAQVRAERKEKPPVDKNKNFEMWRKQQKLEIALKELLEVAK